MINPQFLADLIAAGLPVIERDATEPLTWSREMTRDERRTYEAIKIKYFPNGEKTRALKKRPDLAERLKVTDEKIKDQPLIKDLKDNLQTDLDRLNTMIDTSTNQEVVRLARITRRVYKLVARIIRAD
jgi:hypothetical protein